MLDAESCYRAVKGRDARFDGRFFTGVTTTGVYCRPVCPARTPKRSSVRFFACAAAAEAAGFRACRRCRPEAAPGTPTWMGSAATVSRALRLIEAGALDEVGVPELAERVGVGERQLRRLFAEHLGAGPKSIALTRRLHLARQLVGSSGVRISEIAFASGFASLRQFNDAFLGAFGEPPSALRSRGASRALGTVRLRLAYRAPLDWDGMLAFLAARAIPGVEEVRGDAYVRSFDVEASAPGTPFAPSSPERQSGEQVDPARTSGGALRIAPDGPGALVLEVAGASARALFDVVRRVRRMLDLDADPLAIDEQLGRSELLRESVRARPGLRVVGAFDPFEGLVRAMVGQQVSVAAARTFLGRIAGRFGAELPAPQGPVARLFPSAERLAGADLTRVGLTGARAEAVREISRRVAAGELSLAPAASLPEVVERLSLLPGVGEWTAQVVAMRAFAEPDAFPAGDLALRRAAARRLGHATAASRGGAGVPGSREDRTLDPELERLAEAWRPWRAYAAMHLWALAAPAEDGHGTGDVEG